MPLPAAFVPAIIASASISSVAVLPSIYQQSQSGLSMWWDWMMGTFSFTFTFQDSQNCAFQLASFISKHCENINDKYIFEYKMQTLDDNEKPIEKIKTLCVPAVGTDMVIEFKKKNAKFYKSSTLMYMKIQSISYDGMHVKGLRVSIRESYKSIGLAVIKAIMLSAMVDFEEMANILNIKLTDEERKFIKNYTKIDERMRNKIVENNVINLFEEEKDDGDICLQPLIKKKDD